MTYTRLRNSNLVGGAIHILPSIIGFRGIHLDVGDGSLDFDGTLIGHNVKSILEHKIHITISDFFILIYMSPFHG
jgi:hypothetical protein